MARVSPNPQPPADLKSCMLCIVDFDIIYGTRIIMRSGPRQLRFRDHRMTKGRGGPRRGAGRPRGPAGRVAHRERGEIGGRHPLHVTLRVRSDVASLRSCPFVRAFRRALAPACERGDFRVVHYSLQGNHAHRLVEADDRRALARGMKSVAARLARAVNRVFERSGPVLDGRYHAVALRSPLQVRRALRYVLLNARHHAKRVSKVPRVDLASSGRWFPCWKEPWALSQEDPLGGGREVAEPRSWLLRVGWLRHGRIGLAEVPGTVS